MRQAKKPETEERQNASTPPSKWTCPREQTPATANTSYAVPQRRSRSRLAGSPKPPMESRQAHSIHGVALSKASSRPRCATRASPHRAAEPAPPTTLPKVINKGAAPRPPRPWHQHEADPGAKKQKYAQNCNFFAKSDRRNGAFLAKDTCAFNANQAEQQHGTTAHRPYKHSCPRPWQRSRASSTEKCNI